MEDDTAHTVFDDEKIIEAYTDRSIKPNPGPGGGAVYFPELLHADVVINHLTTINKCELEATLLAFDRIISAKIEEIDAIAIYTDSLLYMKIND